MNSKENPDGEFMTTPLIITPFPSFELCEKCGKPKGNCDHYPPMVYREIVTKDELIKRYEKGATMRVLNLYAGIGGNRKLWEGVEVTAVENNPEIAQIYADYFPEDKLIIGDAHQYLLDHFEEFDFIWSSPPCPTHSNIRHNLGVKARGIKPKFPDMTLYEEIIFLKHHFKGKWVVENVNPYYEPLLPAYMFGRHLFWTNFPMRQYVESGKQMHTSALRSIQIPDLERLHGYDLSKYKIADKRQILRNCVNPQLGLHILLEAKEKELTLFGRNK